MEELVVKATGTTYSASQETMIQVIKNAGRVPFFLAMRANLRAACLKGSAVSSLMGPRL